MREWRSLLPIIVFTALYAVVSLSVTNSYYQLVHDAGAGLGDLRPVVEPAQRLHRADLVRSRRLLRRRRLCRRARPDPFRSVAVDHDPDRRRARRHRRTADRISDLPPAGPLLRAGDARLPARHSLRVRMARLSGSDAADQARQCRSPICNSPITDSTRCWRWR